MSQGVLLLSLPINRFLFPFQGHEEHERGIFLLADPNLYAFLKQPNNFYRLLIYRFSSILLYHISRQKSSFYAIFLYYSQSISRYNFSTKSANSSKLKIIFSPIRWYQSSNSHQLYFQVYLLKFICSGTEHNRTIRRIFPINVSW